MEDFGWSQPCWRKSRRPSSFSFILLTRLPQIVQNHIRLCADCGGQVKVKGNPAGSLRETLTPVSSIALDPCDKGEVTH